MLLLEFCSRLKSIKGCLGHDENRFSNSNTPITYTFESFSLSSSSTSYITVHINIRLFFTMESMKYVR